ncbi:hypothetical protein OAO01_05760 [Oligoflexia bacterium]|nr:hypothetical protein [Oligoflexia bacterium]
MIERNEGAFQIWCDVDSELSEKLDPESYTDFYYEEWDTSFSISMAGDSAMVALEQWQLRKLSEEDRRAIGEVAPTTVIFDSKQGVIRCSHQHDTPPRDLKQWAKLVRGVMQERPPAVETSLPLGTALNTGPSRLGRHHEQALPPIPQSSCEDLESDDGQI